MDDLKRFNDDGWNFLAVPLINCNDSKGQPFQFGSYVFRDSETVPCFVLDEQQVCVVDFDLFRIRQNALD